uniref:Uncharacterized protein n=1 Tax=Arundo donax TaxID=35708 RepID=A0A0A9FXV1_ARUDO
MQFSGQLPRVPGFPSVAMVLPGFVGQQLGGNSEIMGLMTWLPILTDGTGVLEGTCSPPSFDSNCPQPSELASSSVLPRDHGATKDPISSTTQEIPEVVGHELVRRQNRPHRYSEMSFAM